MWGTLFQKYGRGRGWFYATGLASAAVAGAIESAHPSSGEGCDAQRVAVLVLSVAVCAAQFALRPLASVPQQWLSVSQEAVGVATAACAVALSVEGVEACARLQLALGCIGSLMTVGRFLYRMLENRLHAKSKLPNDDDDGDVAQDASESSSSCDSDAGRPRRQSLVLPTSRGEANKDASVAAVKEQQRAQQRINLEKLLHKICRQQLYEREQREHTFPLLWSPTVSFAQQPQQWSFGTHQSAVGSTKDANDAALLL